MVEKYFLVLIISLGLFISNISCKYISNKFLGVKASQNIEYRYEKLNSIHLKNYLHNLNLYIIDTREFEVSNQGYIENSIIMPITFSYSTWFPAIIEEDANVVLICDEENYINALEQTEALGPYKIFGYAIYNELIEENKLKIIKAEYNENTKEDVEKLVEKDEYMIDLREVSEFKETGVIKEAHLMPLSNFRNDYINLPKNLDIYVYCKLGKRALIGMTYAQRAGYSNRFVIMRGGMNKTISEGYPLVAYTE